MRKIITRMFFFLLTMLFICSCGDSNGTDSNEISSDLFLTNDNDGQTVEIGMDNQIVIELESNPSTGYHWEHSNIDGSFIYQDGESAFIENPECSGLDGCGGVERLTFRASQSGYGEISLVYIRSFEEEPADYFTIYVNVF